MSAPIWQVPENVAVGVVERWPETGPNWVERAPAELAELCAEYDATPSMVFPARYALAVAAKARDGRALVLRSSPDPAAGSHATVSQALAQEGLGPAVHEVLVTETGTWMVADRVVPGDSLLRMPITPAVFAEIGRLLRGLADKPAPPGLPKLGNWLRERLEDDDLADRAPNTAVASAAERKQALAILDDLERDQPDHGLCHGDMSGANILRGANDRLFLIDPRGVAGDAAYDAAVLVTKAGGYGIPHDAPMHLIRESGIDESRVEGWAVVARIARV